jgi:5-methylcytosine-specific restriction enzyme subunit McrC
MSHYRDAHILARQLLSGQLRAPTHGDNSAWSFLIKTPELMENGLRAVLVDRLAPHWSVAKTGMQLANSKLRLQPDLVFNVSHAVADIKYKLHDGTWNRPDV